MAESHDDLPALPTASMAVLVGAAGAGKSTLAGRLSRLHAVESLDDQREAVSGYRYDQAATPAAVVRWHEAIAGHCVAGRTVVVDATNAVRAHRAALLAIAHTHDIPAVAIVVDTPLELCLARQIDRPGPLAGRVDGERVPAEVVIAQHRAVQDDLSGLLDEGFAEVYLARGDAVAPAPSPLASRLTLARQTAGYSRAAVAEALGWPSPDVVAEIEYDAREPSAGELGRLARLFHRPVGWFVGEAAAEVVDVTGLTAHDRVQVRRWVEFLRHDQLDTGQ